MNSKVAIHLYKYPRDGHTCACVQRHLHTHIFNKVVLLDCSVLTLYIYNYHGIARLYHE